MPARNRSGPAVPFLWSKEWRALRLLALRRDGWCCVKCGAYVGGKGQARIDHILPRSTHPHLALVLSNTRTLCASCDNQSHREKGQRGPPGTRQERIDIRGADRTGMPLDPNHPWHNGR